jgi:ABC-type Fe3+/spermidine/putrescine transport system ATPase subunit
VAGRKPDAERIAAVIRLVGLAGFETARPRQLSGGMRQRASIARALILEPDVLLLDEPFAALDRKLREEMRREIRALQRQLGITTVFVTHDQEEALTMSDRVVVMNHGAIEQTGTPGDVYEAPANRFVLGFVGFSNFLRVDAIDDDGTVKRCRVAGSECRLGPLAISGKAIDAAGELAIRPERVRIASRDGGGAGDVNRLAGQVRDMAYEGALLSYEIALADGQQVLVREQNASHSAAQRHQPGDAVVVEWRPEDAVLVR